MDTERADPDDLAVLRVAFGVDDDSSAGLGWTAVKAFEAEHGVVLPEPYRTCVADITDGSYAGPPEYGLMPLGELPDDWGDDRPERDLGRPFPLTKTWLWEEDPRAFDEIQPILGQVFDHGSIVLGSDGCGMNWHLVVTGPHRGHVWSISGEGAAPFGAEFGFTTAAAGFAGWVRQWAENRPWFDA